MKAIIWFVLISTVIASCSTAATPPSTSTPMSTSTATFVVKTSTPTKVEPTPTEEIVEPSPTPTAEPTPTLEPTPAPGEVIIHPETGLTQDDVDRFADMLSCQGCIQTGVWSEGSTMDAQISLVSTGNAITREVKNENGVVVGYFDEVIHVVKDATGNGRLVNVVVQMAGVNQPEVNLIPVGVNYVAENYDDISNPTRYSKEYISEVFSVGKLMKYGISSYACWPSNVFEYEELCSILYSDPVYLQRLQHFYDTGEIMDEDPLMIIPMKVS